MTFYTQSGTHTGELTAEHREMLECGSAIAPEVIAESGARSIRHGRDLPPVFSDRQRRRAPGVLFTSHRPNGEESWCFRPDRPRKDKPGHKYEQPPKRLGGAGNVLDILPSQHHLIADPSVPVVFVEGTKKMLSLVSAARAAGETVLVVAIIGCWNWLHDNGTPIPDMRDIPLEGRHATVMYDSDMLRKIEVQRAAGRLAEYLQGRGADAFMTYFDDAPDGSKCGADDYLVAGGTFAGLRSLTRQYDPGDFVRVRLSRDERLRAGLADLKRRFWHAAWRGRGGHSARDLCLKLIEAAATSGAVVEGGIEVHKSWGELGIEVGISSRTVGKALSYLEKRGVILERVKATKARKSGGFVLAADTRAKVKHSRTEQRNQTESNATVASLVTTTLLSRSPRMRWTQPGYRGRRGTVPGTRRVRQSRGPRPRATIRRPGKIRGHVTDVLEYQGGTMTLVEIAAELGVSRPRDLTRRSRSAKGRDGLLIWYMDAGIIAVSEADGVVSLRADYLERVEDVRRAGGEIDSRTTLPILDENGVPTGHTREFFEVGSETLAVARLEDKRRGYRRHLAEQEQKRRQRPQRGHRGVSRSRRGPTEAGLQNVAHSRQRRRDHLERERERPAPEPTNEQDARIARLVYEGMSERWAKAEVMGHAAGAGLAPSEATEPEAARRMPPKIGGVFEHGAVCD